MSTARASVAGSTGPQGGVPARARQHQGVLPDRRRVAPLPRADPRVRLVPDHGQLDYADLRGLFPGRAYVGSDLRPGPGVDRVEDVSALSLPSGSVGTAIAIETFEHVFEVRAAFDEVFRVLRPGGVFVVTLPLNFRIHAYPDDYWRMTPSCLRRMLAPYAASLTVAQGYGKFPHSVLAVAIKAPAPATSSPGSTGWRRPSPPRSARPRPTSPGGGRLRRRVRMIYRSSIERRRLRDHYRATFQFDLRPGSVLRPPTRSQASRPLPSPVASRVFTTAAKEPTCPSPDRLLILGLDGATWSVLDPMRRRGVMPNLDALLATLGPRDAPELHPARHLGRLVDHDDRVRPRPPRRVRPPLPRRRRRPPEGQPLGADPRPDGLAAAFRLRPVGHQPQPAGDLPAAPGPRPGRLGDGRPAPRRRALGHPAFAERLRAEVPGYHLRSIWKRPPRDLAEMEANSRATADLFLAEAQAGHLADRMVPDWSTLLVQFQNLDPFQHRAWRYLNVDETGIDDPAFNAAAHSVMAGLDRAIGELCELADAAARASWSSPTTASAPAWGGSTPTGS